MECVFLCPALCLSFSSNSTNIYQVARISQNILGASDITVNKPYSTGGRETLNNGVNQQIVEYFRK